MHVARGQRPGAEPATNDEELALCERGGVAVAAGGGFARDFFAGLEG